MADRVLLQEWDRRYGDKTVPGGVSVHKSRRDLNAFIRKNADSIQFDSVDYYKPTTQAYWVEYDAVTGPILAAGTICPLRSGSIKKSDDQTDPGVDLWVAGAEAMRESIAKLYENALLLQNDSVDPDEPDLIRSIPLPENPYARR